MKFSITISFLIIFFTITFIQGLFFGNSGGGNNGCSCNIQCPCLPTPSCEQKQIKYSGSNYNSIQNVSPQPSHSYSKQVSSYSSAPLATYISQPSFSSYPNLKQPLFMPSSNQIQTPTQTYDFQPLPTYPVQFKSSYSLSQPSNINSSLQQKYISSDSEKPFSQPSQDYKYKIRKNFLAGAKIHDSHMRIRVINKSN